MILQTLKSAYHVHIALKEDDRSIRNPLGQGILHLDGKTLISRVQLEVGKTYFVVNTDNPKVDMVIRIKGIRIPSSRESSKAGTFYTFEVVSDFAVLTRIGTFIQALRGHPSKSKRK